MCRRPQVILESRGGSQMSIEESTSNTGVMCAIRSAFGSRGTPGFPERSRAAGSGVATSVAGMTDNRTLSTIERLELAADSGTGVTFVGASMATEAGPQQIGWGEIHDDARAVGAALQARGLVPGDHVAILGPTSRELITIIRGCWMAGLASMVLPLPMRMGSLDVFIDSTRGRILHGDAKLLLIDDLLADFYVAAEGDPPIVPMRRPARVRPTCRPARRWRSRPRPRAARDLAVTSGSTSEPKGVMIPDRVLGANIDALSDAAGRWARRRSSCRGCRSTTTSASSGFSPCR